MSRPSRRPATLPHRRGAAILLAAVLTAGCTGPAGSFLDTRSASGAPASGSGASCPAAYAAPVPDRPRIRLDFDLSGDLRTVRGTEEVAFTPDLPVRDVVFRLTPNTAPSVREGNRLEVTAASASPAGAAYRFERAGAAPETQGGLLVVPLGREVPAGQQVTARVEFTLTLGRQAFDRFGRLDQFAWWGSGQPLLAWERGVGWHTEPMLQFTAESATSEAAQVDLTVTAPARYEVLMTGTAQSPVGAGEDRRRWHAVAASARDVGVAVGPFTRAEAMVGDTRVAVGTAPGVGPDRLLAEAVRAVRELSARFGPAPFGVINLARLPIDGGGIEYPGSILMLDDSRVVAVHEVAHQWFYAMVGNSQARDPWLDEAFATWAEQLVDGGRLDTALRLRLPGDVGDPAPQYGANAESYFRTVYGKGSAALMTARTAAGPEKFDAAIRCYVNANAWRIAHPADLAAQLAGLPAALEVLRDAGALPS